MAELLHEETVAQPSRRTEMIAQVVAGPETAARLGVPVGTVVEARHTVSVDGEQLIGESITPEEALELGGMTDEQIGEHLLRNQEEEV